MKLPIGFIALVCLSLLWDTPAQPLPVAGGCIAPVYACGRPRLFGRLGHRRRLARGCCGAYNAGPLPPQIAPLAPPPIIDSNAPELPPLVVFPDRPPGEEPTYIHGEYPWNEDHPPAPSEPGSHFRWHKEKKKWIKILIVEVEVDEEDRPNHMWYFNPKSRKLEPVNKVEELPAPPPNEA